MVTIHLFASLKDAAGCGCLSLEPSPEATPGVLFQDLIDRFPDLARFQKNLLVAVNEEYARMDFPVRDGDEIAFFPPVSGG